MEKNVEAEQQQKATQWQATTNTHSGPGATSSHLSIASKVLQKAGDFTTQIRQRAQPGWMTHEALSITIIAAAEENFFLALERAEM
jgi:L-serine deaminase